MTFLKILACALLSYLLGSLNFGIIITKLFTGLDLRTQGSGNAGSTNAYRVLGLGPTVLVVLGDILKGVLAVLFSRWLMGADGQALSMCFVILGHVHPVFYDFKGGKGVLTTAAMVGVYDWRLLALVLLFLVIVIITRYVSLGSVIAVGLIPVGVWLLHPEDTLFIFCTLFVSTWIVILHTDNLIRLKNGTERRFRSHKADTEAIAPPEEGSEKH